MQRMELNELRELEKIGVEATLYAKDVRGEHPNVKKIPYNDYDKHLFDLPFPQPHQYKQIKLNL